MLSLAARLTAAVNKKMIVLSSLDLHAYQVAVSMIAPPLIPHLFLPKITNNYRDKPPRFGQTITIAIGHARDCYVQFDYSCKQLYHVEKFFKMNIGPIN